MILVIGAFAPIAFVAFLPVILVSFLLLFALNTFSSTERLGRSRALPAELSLAVISIPLLGLFETLGISAAFYWLGVAESGDRGIDHPAWVILFGTLLLSIEYLYLVVRDLKRLKTGMSTDPFEPEVSAKLGKEALEEKLKVKEGLVPAFNLAAVEWVEELVKGQDTKTENHACPASKKSDSINSKVTIGNFALLQRASKKCTEKDVWQILAICVTSYVFISLYVLRFIDVNLHNQILLALILTVFYMIEVLLIKIGYARVISFELLRDATRYNWLLDQAVRETNIPAYNAEEIKELAAQIASNMVMNQASDCRCFWRRRYKNS